MADAVVTVNAGDGIVVGVNTPILSLPDGIVTAGKIGYQAIVDTDISSSAAINKAKISGTAVTIADTGTVTSTMIANGTIVDADVNASAAIAKTKIAGTAVTVADTGTVTSTMILDGTILNADINASAAIAWSKISTASLKGTATVTLADAGTYSYGSTTITVPSGSTLVATIASSSYSGADDYACIVSVSGTTGTIKVRCANDSVVGDVTVNWIAL